MTAPRIPEPLARLYRQLDGGQRQDLVESLWQLDRELARKARAVSGAMCAMPLDHDDTAKRIARLGAEHTGLLDAGDYLRDVADALEQQDTDRHRLASVIEAASDRGEPCVVVEIDMSRAGVVTPAGAIDPVPVCTWCGGHGTVACETCDGAGHHPDDPGEPCPNRECDAGDVECPDCGGHGTFPPPGAAYTGPDPAGQFPTATDLDPAHWQLEPGPCPGGCGRETPAGGLCPGCWGRVHAEHEGVAR